METCAFPLEIKSLSEREFTGYGAVFKNRDLGGDIIIPGAFTKSLAQHEQDGALPVMLWSHQPDVVIGKWHEMKEDKNGLFVRGEIADTAFGRDVHKLMKMKAVSGMSIGYQTKNADFDRDGNRLLKTVDLYEVSIVSMPMNPKANIEAVKRIRDRGIDVAECKREIEHVLREKGFSKSEAKSAASRLLASDYLETLGEMPSEEKNGDEPGAMPDESRRDAGEAEELERAAKALNQGLREKELDREIQSEKLSEDQEFEESLKTLADDLVALRFERRWRRTG